MRGREVTCLSACFPTCSSCNQTIQHNFVEKTVGNLNDELLSSMRNLDYVLEKLAELLSCRTAPSARTLVPSGFDFDDAPANFEASLENGRRLSPIWGTRRTKVATTEEWLR